MSMVMRLFELLASNKKLNESKPHVLQALSGLAAVMLLGVFATVMAALMVGALLWLIYIQMQGSGVGDIAAVVVTLALALLVVAIAAFAALQLWKTVRTHIDAIFHSQTPVVGHVADRVTHAAQSFWAGLRGNRAR